VFVILESSFSFCVTRYPGLKWTLHYISTWDVFAGFPISDSSPYLCIAEPTLSKDVISLSQP